MASFADVEDYFQFTAEQSSQFKNGVDAIFKRWTAINLAIEHQMLGDSTEQDFLDLKENLKKWISQDGDVIKAPEVQQYIEDVILEDLGLEVQDGSIAEVSVALMKLFGECARNDFTGVVRLVELANKQSHQGVSRSYRKKYQNEACSHHHDHNDQDDDKMEEDEGWTTVHRKR